MDYQNSVFPFGIAAANLLNEGSVHTDDGHLTEAEKEKMIFQYKDADSMEKKERIKDSLPSNESASDIFGGPSIG